MNRDIKNHLLISGTGRAGTSFLVQYLTELGLDTGLARNKNIHYDENANAGLENSPLDPNRENLPYVIKLPIFGQIIEQILSDSRIKIDAVIIPIRDLIEAATSRIIIEMRRMHEIYHTAIEFDKALELWGVTAGGAIFSLNPIDQARILAVDFHHLIHQLVCADIPIIFLEFPKLAQDPDYIFKKLKQLLPTNINAETARLAHQKIANRAKIRVEDELKHSAEENQNNMFNPEVIKGREAPGCMNLEKIAIRREMTRLRAKIKTMEEEISKFQSTIHQGKEELNIVEKELSQIRNSKRWKLLSSLIRFKKIFI